MLGEAGSGMIMACIELLPAHDKRQEILQILQFVEHGVRKNPACTWCGIYENKDTDASILYLEQWKSERELYSHIQSRSYLPLLNAIDLAGEQPKVSFYEVGGVRSMELIETLRNRENTA